MRNELKFATAVSRVKKIIVSVWKRLLSGRTTAQVSNELEVRSFVFGNSFEYSKIRVGDYLDGRVVDRIYFSGLNGLVLHSGGELRYLSRIKTNKNKALIQQLESLLSKAFIKFRGVHRFTLESHRISLLTLIFGAESDGVQLASDIFESLERFIDEKPKVEYVFEYGAAFVVFLNSKGEVAYQVKDVKAHPVKAFTEYQRLKALGMLVLPKNKIERFNHKLASGFISALKSLEVDVGECFSPVQMYLDKTIGNIAGLYLVLSILSVSGLVFLGLFWVYFYCSTPLTLNLNILLTGIAGGLVGAAISVLQRSKDIKVAAYDSTGLLVLQSIVRVGLGCCFGVIAIVASKSGLLLEFLSGNYKKMFLLAVVAGFSERMIPDFIEKITEDKKA